MFSKLKELIKIIIVKKEHIEVMTTFHVYVVFAYLKINPIRHLCIQWRIGFIFKYAKTTYTWKVVITTMCSFLIIIISMSSFNLENIKSENNNY